MINKVSQRLAKRQTNDIKLLKRNVRELKTPQSQGADVISVDRLPSGGFAEGGPLTIASGNTSTFEFTASPANDTLTLWNYLFTLYIDGDDENHKFPGGSSITGGMLNIQMEYWADWADSSDSTNVRVFKTHIRNNDSISHTFYIKGRVYLPHNPGTDL